MISLEAFVFDGGLVGSIILHCSDEQLSEIVYRFRTLLVYCYLVFCKFWPLHCYSIWFYFDYRLFIFHDFIVYAHPFSVRYVPNILLHRFLFFFVTVLTSESSVVAFLGCLNTFDRRLYHIPFCVFQIYGSIACVFLCVPSLTFLR